MVSMNYREQPSHRAIRGGWGRDVPRIESSSAPLAANDDILPRLLGPRRESVLEGLWYVAVGFPFHSATLVPAVAVVLTLIGGPNLYRSLWTSLSMADPISATLSVLLALVVAAYSLLAT
jgi:hypothetical protein